jgi:hypothetical protein
MPEKNLMLAVSSGVSTVYTSREPESLADWRKRFVSDSESNEMIGGFTKAAAEARRKLAEIDTKLGQLGERLEQLGRALRDTKQSVSKDSLRALLRFGPESGVTVDGIVDVLNERQRLAARV